MMTLNIGSQANPGDDTRPALKLHEYGDGTYAPHMHDVVAIALLTDIKALLTEIRNETRETRGSVNGKAVVKTATITGIIL